jgi:hypothetical protein
MKYLLFICLSIQAYACKEDTSDHPECTKCDRDLGKCMADALEKSTIETRQEDDDTRKACHEAHKKCTTKNNCLNKE